MTNYNDKTIDIDSILKNEILKAIHVFAEGSEILEECLKQLYNNGLKTVGCCKGYHKIDAISFMQNKLDYEKLSNCIFPAYIGFEKNIDVFSFLSKELINDSNVVLVLNRVCTSIYFVGENHEKLMWKFLNDLKSGRKNNRIDLLKKMNQCNTPLFWYKSFLYGLTKSGFSDIQIDSLKEILCLFACIQGQVDTIKEIEDFCLSINVSENIKDIVVEKLKEFKILDENKKLPII